MRKFVVLFLCGLALSGCGVSASGSNFLGSLNPFSGSGDQGGTGETTATPDVIADGSVLVERLDTAVPEQALRGVIIKVSGTAPTPGYANARLVPLNRREPDEDGIVTFEFRADPPGALIPVGSARSLNLIAAAFVPETELEGIRGFQIVARTNAVSIRR